MREDLLNEVFQDLQALQRRNEETENRRRQEIMDGYPGIARLAQQREELIRNTLQDILDGKVTAEDLPERMESVSMEIRKALRENGFPENYLAPVYECPECRDTGYVGDRVKENANAYRDGIRKSCAGPSACRIRERKPLRASTPWFSRTRKIRAKPTPSGKR